VHPGSIIKNDRKMKDNVKPRIEWIKWSNALSVFLGRLNGIKVHGQQVMIINDAIRGSWIMCLEHL